MAVSSLENSRCHTGWKFGALSEAPSLSASQGRLCPPFYLEFKLARPLNPDNVKARGRASEGVLTRTPVESGMLQYQHVTLLRPFAAGMPVCATILLFLGVESAPVPDITYVMIEICLELASWFRIWAWGSVLLPQRPI